MDSLDMKPMVIDPKTYYDAKYWSARKPYRAIEDGGIVERLYQGPALWWDGFGPIASALIHALGSPRPQTWIDLGCGGGCFVGFLRQLGVDARGIDISTHAIETARPAVREFVRYGDIADDADDAGYDGWPDRYDVVSATDLVEHIYLADQDALWAQFARRGSTLVINVATARGPHEIWTPAPGTEVPIEREWQAVSGHVCIQPTLTWLEWAQERGWHADLVAMERFQAWRRSAPGYAELTAWDDRNVLIFRR